MLGCECASHLLDRGTGTSVSDWWVSLPSLVSPMPYPGQQAQDDDSSDSETEEPSVSQDPKDTSSQPSSTSHRPRAASCRATATWCTDSGSDDSRRWSDQLSLDEKDGFIFVNYSEGQTRAHLQGPLAHPHPNPIEARSYSRLKPGYRWERQLVFRSKLTMHTAFDRKDNTHPAEVTALGVSKDHSRILVGDSRGRVFSWSVSDQPGRSAADHWVKDEGGDSCSGCSVRFSLTERRHHCRNCGQLFCQKCSRFQSEIKRLKISSPVRVCQNCYYSLQHERGAEDGPRNCWDGGTGERPQPRRLFTSCRDSRGTEAVSVYTALHWVLEVLSVKESLDHGFRGQWPARVLCSEQHKRKWLPGASQTWVSPSVAVSKNKPRAPQLSFLHLIFIELFILIWKN